MWQAQGRALELLREAQRKAAEEKFEERRKLQTKSVAAVGGNATAASPPPRPPKLHKARGSKVRRWSDGRTGRRGRQRQRGGGGGDGEDGGSGCELGIGGDGRRRLIYLVRCHRFERLACFFPYSRP